MERCCDHALSLVEGMGRLPGVEVLSVPIINQGLVRFLSPADADHDTYTDEVIAAIVEDGEALFSGTTWNGHRAMRISVCNWRTTAEDVERTLHSVASVLESKRALTGERTTRA